MAEASLRLPPSLDIHDGNLGENYKRWKREVETECGANGNNTALCRTSNDGSV